MFITVSLAIIALIVWSMILCQMYRENKRKKTLDYMMAKTNELMRESNYNSVPILSQETEEYIGKTIDKAFEPYWVDLKNLERQVELFKIRKNISKIDSLQKELDEKIKSLD